MLTILISGTSSLSPAGWMLKVLVSSAVFLLIRTHFLRVIVCTSGNFLKSAFVFVVHPSGLKCGAAASNNPTFLPSNLVTNYHHHHHQVLPSRTTLFEKCEVYLSLLLGQSVHIQMSRDIPHY
jgi:hypothetical protein